MSFHVNDLLLRSGVELFFLASNVKSLLKIEVADNGSDACGSVVFLRDRLLWGLGSTWSQRKTFVIAIF